MSAQTTRWRNPLYRATAEPVHCRCFWEYVFSSRVCWLPFFSPFLPLFKFPLEILNLLMFALDHSCRVFVKFWVKLTYIFDVMNNGDAFISCINCRYDLTGTLWCWDKSGEKIDKHAWKTNRAPTSVGKHFLSFF